jgi:hypothetical protein
MPFAEKTEEAQRPSKESVEEQVALLVGHPAFRSSKRLVSFLQYVVTQVLTGSADQLKERTIGVAVFDRPPDYDTNNDHIVRSAASELRKRLAVYYGYEAHQDQLRIDLPPGSYVPQFAFPKTDLTIQPNVVEPPFVAPPPLGNALSPPRERFGARAWVLVALASAAIVSLAIVSFSRLDQSPRKQFWNPVVNESGPVLIVIGDPRTGPPEPAPNGYIDSPPAPKSQNPGLQMATMGDAIAVARLTSVLGNAEKPFLVREESQTSYSDLRNGPTILVGLFNNEWSLRLSRSLRFGLGLDAQRHLIYIRDNRATNSRVWSVVADYQTNPPANRASGQPMRDFALISRVVNSDTGKALVVIGGLYTYGTQAAAEFISDRQLDKLTAGIPLTQRHKNLQIVLETDVTEGIPGPPKVVAYSLE